MASTPMGETRSPLTLLDKIPKEHEKAIKQAFYNTAANIFLVLACATLLAVYFILEAFLKPLLWAVLCGAFLYPFKRSLTGVLRNWLKGLHDSETPFLVGLVLTPVRCVDDVIEGTCNKVFNNLKLVAAVLVGIPTVYVLWHFGPLKSVLGIVQGAFFFTYDLLGYFTSFWIWTLAVAYLVAIIFIWNQESQSMLKALSVPLWLLLILHIAATAGILRVPLLILMGVGVTMGFLAEKKEAHRQQTEGTDPNRQSMFETMVSKITGATPSPESPRADQSDQPATQQVPVETIPAPAKAGVTKPNTLNVDSSLKPHVVLSPATEAPPSLNHSLSDQCFIGLFWAHVLTRVFQNIWLVSILLPLPLAIWAIKKLGIKLMSDDGPMGDKVKGIRQSLGNWIRDRKDVLMPKWLRGVLRLVIKGDQKIISILESSLDSATSVVFILLLLIGGVVFSIFFAIQVQQESMYIVKTTSNLLNETLHPEMANWLPNNQDVQEAMDSMVGNAYVYGRNWIASKVRDLVNGPTADNSTQIETQVLDLWDRLYDAWLSRNASSTSLAKPESPESESQWMPINMSNLTSIWDVATQSSAFNFGDIVPFVKENIGTFVSVLESIWLVLKGNMNLVMSVLTSILSLVMGGGTAILNFVLSSIIFLTTLFYLLASSGDQYKPIQLFSSMSPPSPSSGGNTFGQAVQDAVGGVFMASLKMGMFYGLYTWLTHLLFGVNIIFIPSALAAVFGAIPFVGTYLAAVPGVLELWLVHDKFVMAILLLVCHFIPSYVVDTAIYSEIKGGHPYMTGLAIAGGMYWLGLEGAIFGPIILCVLVVLVNVYTSMMKPETPSFLSEALLIFQFYLILSINPSLPTTYLQQTTLQTYRQNPDHLP